jgi:hypothetical protein
MKKSVLYSIIVVISTISCNRGNNKTCYQGDNNFSEENELIVKIGDCNFKSNIKVWDYRSFTLTFQTIKRNQFESLIASLKKTSNFEFDSYAIVLYASKLLCKTTSITYDDIIGLSYFYVAKNKMYHRFYQKKSQGLKVDSYFDCEVDGVISNDLHKITLNIFDPIIYPEKSWILFFSDDKKNIQLEDPKHQLTVQLKKRISLTNKQQEPDDDCAPPCMDGGKNPCHLSPLYGETCNPDDEKPCLDNEIEEICKNNSSSYVNMPLNKTLHRQLRDSLFNLSQNGKTIIQDYYSLSKYYAGKVSINIALETARTLFHCNTAISIILRKDKQKIAISRDLAIQISNLIDSYINITDSSEIKSKLLYYKKLVGKNIGLKGSQIHL